MNFIRFQLFQICIYSNDSFMLELAIMMQIAQLEDIRPLLRIVNANNIDNPYQGTKVTLTH